MRKTKHCIKVLLWSAFLLASFLIPTSIANATSQTIVKVEPPICFAHVGETFTINITIINVQNLYGIDVALYWNASILKIVKTDVRMGKEDYPDGVLYKPIYKNETFMEGKYILYGLSMPPAPSFNGSGTIVRITFNVTNEGTCDLNLETKLASNIIPPGGIAVEEIPHKTANGFFGPILLTAYPKRLNLGQSVNISGTIATAQANVTVTIFYKLEEETEWHTFDMKTNEQGSYCSIWTPDESGTYYLKAKAFILGSEQTSQMISIEVIEPQQSPWPYTIILIVILIITSSLLAVTMLLLIRRKRARRSVPHAFNSKVSQPDPQNNW